MAGRGSAGRICGAIGINDARNLAVEHGAAYSKFTAVLDGTCYFPRKAWNAVQQGIVHRPHPFNDVTANPAGRVPTDSTCVLVLGNHRTGSSALAALLQGLGVNMGGAGEIAKGNPRGLFEDLDVRLLHQRMLGEVGENTIAWMKHEVDFAPVARDYRRLLWVKSLQRLWGMKDPRLCFLLRHFVESCPPHVRFRFILTSRPLRDCVRSMAKRDEMAWIEARRVLADYQQALSTSLAPYSEVPSLTVDFNDLIEDTNGTGRAVARFLGLPYHESAAGGVDPNLRHWNAAKPT